MNKSRQNKRDRPILRRLVVDCKHKPTLEFYPYIEQVGIKLQKDFPDWARGNSALRLLNKESRRSLTAHFRGVALLCDKPGDEEFKFAEYSCGIAIETLKAKEFDEIIVQTLYAHHLSMDFSAIKSRLAEKFFVGGDPIDELFGELIDLGYTADCKLPGGQLCKVRMGPMTVEQWFELNDYQSGTVSAPGALEDLRNTLPKVFLFIDLAFMKKAVKDSDVKAFIREVYRLSSGLSSDIIEYFKE